MKDVGLPCGQEQPTLSERQAQVLLLGRGLNVKQIAVRLGISSYTVQRHMNLARRRTGGRSTYQLVAMVAVADWKRKNKDKVVAEIPERFLKEAQAEQENAA